MPLIGASGAIAGVMGAYLVLFPRHLVMTLVIFRIVAIPAVFFLGLWFLSQFFMAGGDGGIAWEAHVAGFLFGMLVALPFRRRLLGNTLQPPAGRPGRRRPASDQGRSAGRSARLGSTRSGRSPAGTAPGPAITPVSTSTVVQPWSRPSARSVSGRSPTTQVGPGPSARRIAAVIGG